MYPDLIKNASKINSNGKSFLYKYSKIPDVKALLEVENEFSAVQIKEIDEQLLQNGNEIAGKFVLEYINKNKITAFKYWINLLNKKYPHQHAFHYLILLPIFELYGQNQRRLLPKPNVDSIEVLYKRISNELLNPNNNISKVYFNRIVSKYKVEIINTWKFISKGIENAPLLSSLAYRSGWCITSYYSAEFYIKTCDFLILYDNNIPVVAIRCDLEKKQIHEIRGRNNAIPNGLLSEIYLLLNYLKFDCTAISLLNSITVKE